MTQVVKSRVMSFARATGERFDAPRSSYDELEELRDAYVQRNPIRQKYFAIVRMRLQWRLRWDEIIQVVGLNRSHCWRVFKRAQSDLQALGKKNRDDVARGLRIVTEDDDE